jgi:hypothetical protein
MTRHRPPDRPAEDSAPADDAGAGPASGSVAHPIPPGEAQPGDRNEQAAGLGGPVDVFPVRGPGSPGRGKAG